MHVLCIFSTNLTLGNHNQNLHSIVRSRRPRPVVVPIQCPQPKTMAPTALPKRKVPEQPLAKAIMQESIGKSEI